MKRIVGTVVAVAVAASLVAGSRYLGLWKGTGSENVDVNLSMQGLVCRAQDPQPLGGVWQKKITWTVVNNCTSPQYVSFGNYREHLGAQLGPPEKVVEPNPAFSAQINPNGTEVLKGKIAKWNWFSEGSYKYDICVGSSPQPASNCTDPDVDVWPVF
jgi:hypothetical protein